MMSLPRTVASALAVGAMASCAAVLPGAAAGDTSLGTVGGISYVEDETAPVPSGVTSSSPLVLARCPIGTELLGGGAEFNYGGTGAVMHDLFPTTTEGSEGSLAFDFANNSGSALTGTVVASCTGVDADPVYRGENDDLPTHAVRDLTAKCPNARQVSGGGAFMTNEAYKANLSRSFPVDDGDADDTPDDGWKVRVWSRQSPDESVTAYAICTDRPNLSYRTKRVTVPIDKNAQPFVTCREDRPAVAAGFFISGFEDHSILNALTIYDGGDMDLAPDDGAQARVANILEEKRGRVFAICRR